MKAKLIVAIAAFAMGSAPALAQGGPGTGPRNRMARNFDPATVTTVSGEVTAIHKVEGRRNEGMHVVLKTADATYDVHLGPTAFLASRSIEPRKGDRLEVTGSKVEIRGKPALVAQTVKKGDATVTLRDAEGIPAWARGPKR